MKKGRILALAMALAITVTSFIIPSNVQAQTLNNKGVDINLGDFNLSIPEYNKNEVNIQTIENGNDVSVTISDKETGAVLETITSEPLPNDSPQLSRITSESSYAPQSTSYYSIKRDKVDALVTVRLECVVVLYQSGSFSSVNSIEGTDFYPISSSNAVLENSSAYARSATGTFPTTNVQYYGTGVITIVTTVTSGEELSIGFSIPEVIDFGYSVNTSISGTVYLRKPVTISGNFYTYSQGN
jgi:hypothetical protein